MPHFELSREHGAYRIERYDGHLLTVHTVRPEHDAYETARSLELHLDLQLDDVEDEARLLDRLERQLGFTETAAAEAQA